MVFAGLVASSSATAANPTAHVYLSDYTPQNEQEVTLYATDLAPNTEYSFGYMFIYGNDNIADLFWLEQAAEIDTFITDSNGRAEFNFIWYFSPTEDYDIYSGTYPSKIWVNSLGAVPANPSDLLAVSSQVIPGQNAFLGDGEIALSGPGVDQNGFVNETPLTISLSDFSIQVDSFEIYVLEDSVADNINDFWEFNLDNEFPYDGFPYVGPYETGNVVDGSASSTISFEVPSAITKFMMFYFNMDMNDHTSGWLYADTNGNIFPAKEIIVPADIAETVKPFSYVKAAYGADIADDQIVVTNAAYCTSAGDKIVFLAKGTCTWDVLDSDGNLVSSDSALITSGANALSSRSLAHQTVKFSKKSKNLNKAEKRKILKLTDQQLWDQVIVFGYSWKEGSKKIMNKLSQSRTTSVVDYLSKRNHTVVIFGGRGSRSPIYTKGKKQSLNRRVEIVEMPSEAQ